MSAALAQHRNRTAALPAPRQQQIHRQIDIDTAALADAGAETG